MDIAIKEYLISRISAGYLKYQDKLKIYSPTLETWYHANEIYQEAFTMAQNMDICDDNDIYELLILHGFWTTEDEKLYQTILHEDIVMFQEELFKNHHKPSEINRIRKYLRRAKEKLEELSTIRTQFDGYTCEGVANHCRFKHVIENSTWTMNNAIYDWSDISVTTILHYCNNNVILPQVIRELSHTHPWMNTWSASKHCLGVFNKTGVELSTPQQLLIVWSNMYDSIRESTECPSDDVIDDDDILDGWLSLQRKKQIATRRGNFADNLISHNSKLRHAQELYIKAENIEDAKRINELSNTRQKAIKQYRLAKIKKQGATKIQEFSDIQQQRAIQLTNAYNQHMRQKG